MAIVWQDQSAGPHLLQEVGQQGQGLAAHQLIGVRQAGCQAGQVGVHQGGVLHTQVGQGHHDVVAHCRGPGGLELLHEEGHALLGQGLVCQAQLAQRHPGMSLHSRCTCATFIERLKKRKEKPGP